jgi:Zn-dependent peptidase ImmA (M78 family)
MSDQRSVQNPERLLEHLGIARPEEIDIEAIAQYCGATVVYELLRTSEARLLGHGDHAIITVNSASARPRQRFGAAHELGHWANDRGRVAFECDEATFATAWREESRERRANQYAADLLLPPSMFDPLARRTPFTFDAVRALAATFETSLTATAIRLVERGSYLGMVLCNDASGRRWFVKSQDLPNVIWPLDQPGPNTLASELLRGQSPTTGPVEVYASEWTSHENAGRYPVKEDSVRITPEHVLSLVWWEDEEQLLDLEDE